MNQNEVLDLLIKERIDTWNQFRQANPGWVPDLSDLDLSNVPFSWSGDRVLDLSRAVLTGCRLPYRILEALIYQKVWLKDAIYDSQTEADFDLAEFGAVFVTEDYQSRLGAAKQTTVFISYAWANEDVIVAIDQWLRLKGIDVQIDRRDLFAGSRIRDEILRTMKDSDVVLIFYSKESKDKPWTQFAQELAADLAMAAKKEGKSPPRIMYVVIDDTPLPDVTESNKIAIMAKGKRFEFVCEEIYHNILRLPRSSDSVDLDKWSNYTF